jgi:hypothetical protein
MVDVYGKDKGLTWVEWREVDTLCIMFLLAWKSWQEVELGWILWTLLELS